MKKYNDKQAKKAAMFRKLKVHLLQKKNEIQRQNRLDDKERQYQEFKRAHNLGVSII